MSIRGNIPVVAAIPHYNMAPSAINLVQQTCEHGYDEVYVLDDASRPEHLDNLMDTVGSVATIVRGETNAGAGANRNRILSALSHNALIHFMDADVTLETEGSPEHVREMADRPALGFVGGLVLDESGRQMPWNYGTRMSPYSSLRAGTVAAIEAIRPNHPQLAFTVRKVLAGMLKGWPNPDIQPTECPVFWTSEANLAIEANTFRALGGFDEKLREHEIQDLAIRAHTAGRINRFNPAVTVTHHPINVRDYNRNRAMMQAERYIIRKHGLKNWLLPPASV